MKTDELLYELVRLDPTSVFRLVQLDLEGEYAFESITLKTIEKRIDGFLKRTDGPGRMCLWNFRDGMTLKSTGAAFGKSACSTKNVTTPRPLS